MRLLKTLGAVLFLATLGACHGDDSDGTSAGDGAGGQAGASSSTGGQGGEAGASTSQYLRPPKSCAYKCGSSCQEDEHPYECPAMEPWDDIPHADQCGAWDGKYPNVVAGKCTATLPSRLAVRKAGPDPQHPEVTILPSGRPLRPAGDLWVFDEKDIHGGQTVSMIPVPGTSFVLTVDIGSEDQAVRCVDTTRIGHGSPVTGYVVFPKQQWLSAGVAFAPPDRVYVPTPLGVVQALKLDTSTGKLTKNDSASIRLPDGGGQDWYASSVAVSPDGATLVVTGVYDKKALVYDAGQGASYGKLLGSVDMGFAETFAVAFDPHDASGSRAYVSGWGSRKVAELDLSDRAHPKLLRTFQTDHDPQGMAFLDGRWMVVANDLGETVSVIDRGSGTVTSLPVSLPSGLHGLDLSTLTWDESNHRLYATLSGIDAVRVFDVDMHSSPPKILPVGDIPTAWWPTSVVIDKDGAVVIASMRGKGIGAVNQPYDIGGGDGDGRMRGAVQRLVPPDDQTLRQWHDEIMAGLKVDELEGMPRVDCPSDENDFPVPTTNKGKPSSVIRHVFLIVRENKTFDALLGDLEGVDGDPKLTMKSSSGDMDRIWTNFRKLARAFTTADNFYNAAVKSVQGHTWTTFGRTTDFDERTWSAEARKAPLSGIAPVGWPEEGSLFEWLVANRVDQNIFGEVVGAPKKLPDGYDNPLDARYPGGPFQNMTYSDLEKACYLAARLRVTCDLKKVVYLTLPNDHTTGLKPDRPTPETMCAVNDEATGMFIDALSHSPLWASSLVIITEDDPQQGGEHVDYHRTPFVMVSPWVKRGYVTHTHMDAASMHKLIAHIFALPYLNINVKYAPVPYDAFTSTPDYTPYEYVHRQWPLTCGTNATSAEQRLTDSWDFDEVDEQPGLGQQVMRWMRGVQLQKMPAWMERQVERRLEMRR